MCKCIFKQYVCRHESKRDYIDCRTGKPMYASSSGCGKMEFDPKDVSGTCETPGCNYQELMAKGWRCCECGKGPNEKDRCPTVLAVHRWDVEECEHQPCMDCTVWADKK